MKTYKVDGSLIFISIKQLLDELRIADLSADSHSPSDSILNLCHKRNELTRCLYTLHSHARLGSMKCRNIEKPMRFLYMTDMHLRREMDTSDGLRQTDDGLELTHGDRDAVASLTHLLIPASLAIGNIHVLERVARLFSEFREAVLLGIGNILANEIEVNVGSALLDLLVHK